MLALEARAQFIKPVSGRHRERAEVVIEASFARRDEIRAKATISFFGQT